MGLFLDLSDDFNAQRIFPRFMSAPDAPPKPTPNTPRDENASFRHAVVTASAEAVNTETIEDETMAVANAGQEAAQ